MGNDKSKKPREFTGNKWERQEWETARSFEVFEIYRKLGPKRSIPKVAVKAGYSNDSYARQLSARYHWQERIEAWERHVDRNALFAKMGHEGADAVPPMHLRQLADFMQAQQQIYERAMTMATNLLNKCDAELELWTSGDAEQIERMTLTPSQIATTAKHAISLADSASDAKAREMGIEEIIGFIADAEDKGR